MRASALLLSRCFRQHHRREWLAHTAWPTPNEREGMGQEKNMQRGAATPQGLPEECHGLPVFPEGPVLDAFNPWSLRVKLPGELDSND